MELNPRTFLNDEWLYERVSATEASEDYNFSKQMKQEIVRAFILYAIEVSGAEDTKATAGNNAYKQLGKCISSIDKFYSAWSVVIQNPYIITALKERAMPIEQVDGWGWQFLADLQHLQEAMVFVHEKETLEQSWLPKFKKVSGNRQRVEQRQLITVLNGVIAKHLPVTLQEEIGEIISELLDIVEIELSGKTIINSLSR